jgi:hypothetical protein
MVLAAHQASHVDNNTAVLQSCTCMSLMWAAKHCCRSCSARSGMLQLRLAAHIGSPQCRGKGLLLV